MVCRLNDLFGVWFLCYLHDFKEIGNPVSDKSVNALDPISP